MYSYVGVCGTHGADLLRAGQRGGVQQVEAGDAAGRGAAPPLGARDATPPAGAGAAARARAALAAHATATT